IPARSCCSSSIPSFGACCAGAGSLGAVCTLPACALFACDLLASLLLTWAARGASTAHAAAPQSASTAAASAHAFFLPCRCRFLAAIGPRPPFCFSACGAAHCAHSTVFY